MTPQETKERRGCIPRSQGNHLNSTQLVPETLTGQCQVASAGFQIKGLTRPAHGLPGKCLTILSANLRLGLVLVYLNLPNRDSVSLARFNFILPGEFVWM